MDIAGTSKYCDQTGGDCYDYFNLPDNRLGAVEELTFQENIREGWNSGSVLVIGTDGIWEARNQPDEMFGQNRYIDVIRKHATDSAQDIQDAVIRAVESFQGDAAREDDLTLVVVKLL